MDTAQVRNVGFARHLGDGSATCIQLHSGRAAIARAVEEIGCDVSAARILDRNSALICLAILSHFDSESHDVHER
ncbi:hypothetical protein Sjap_010899 [Stephania japonica]|uniref:Uncharacterized protein n=1 Tax=Stephania japonica TaxID=461633 RepID=A0AAP0JCH9_9MAGN